MDILQEVKDERKRQDEKWGEQNHHPAEWLMILGEEVGEANKAALEAHFNCAPLSDYRKELIQVAAVAVVMIESLDRHVKDARKCRVCGCTDLHGCEGGCWWVEDDLCSSCQ